MADRVRFGVISTAKIGLRHVIPAMQKSPFCEMTAIASRDAQRAAAVARSLGIPRSFGSYDELLADPDIDAVYNPLPNHLHVPLSLRAMDAGKHVLCEKPIGLNVAEAEQLMAGAQRHPELKIMEAFMYRHHPQWQTAAAYVADERVGDLRTIHSFFSYLNRDPEDIRNCAHWGGGGLMDIGCYPISLSRFVFRDEPRRVISWMEMDPDFGVDRLASAMMEFPRGMATFTCSTQLAPYQRVQIVGTRGRIEIEIPFNALTDRPCRLWLQTEASLQEIELPVCNQYTIQGDLFAQAILSDTPVPTPLTDAVANMRVLDALKASHVQGGWIRLQPVFLEHNDAMWGFRPIFGSYALVILVVLGMGALIAVRPARAGHLAPGREQALRYLRIAVYLCVVLAMLRPTLVRTESRIEPAQLIVLADQSRSMSVADQGNQTRWQVVRGALTRVENRLTESRNVLVLRSFVFDARARLLPDTQSDPTWPDEPTGEQTDVAGALEDALQQSSADPIAAVIVLSDGTQRVSAPRVPWQQPARELARRGIPLYTVAVGQERERSQARDVSMLSLPDDYAVFAANELAIRGAVRIQGYVNRPIPVTLRVEQMDGTAVHTETRNAQVTEDGDVVDAEFRYVPPEPGEFFLRVTAAVQDDEQIVDNNELGAFLHVAEGGVRVLYLDGNPAWQEQKFIRRAIDAAVEIDVDYAWVDIRTRANWPVPLQKLFDQQPYDVILLGDVHGNAFGPEGMRWLAKQVEDGLGLMMIGGARSFGAGGYGRVPEMAAVLPVEMADYELRAPDAELDPRQHVMQELRMTPDGDHFLTRLGGENQQLWNELPPLVGANRLQPTAAGRVLLWGIPVDPAGRERERTALLVAGEYGRGRVLAFAGDSTFRWYRRGFQAAHFRFWRQAVLWLAHQDQAGDNEVWIDLAERRLPSFSAASFRAGMRSPEGTPVSDADLSVTLTLEATLPEDAIVPEATPPESGISTSLPVDWAAGRAEARGQTAVLQTAGRYRVDVVATRNGEELGSANARFIVTQQDLELADPVANPQQLAQLANLTSEAGGRAVAPEQLAAVIDQLAQQRESQKVEFEQRWQLGDTALDAWSFFLVMIGLLSTEWYLRKRWSLG